MKDCEFKASMSYIPRSYRKASLIRVFDQHVQGETGRKGGREGKDRQKGGEKRKAIKGNYEEEKRRGK